MQLIKQLSLILTILTVNIIIEFVGCLSNACSDEIIESIVDIFVIRVKYTY